MAAPASWFLISGAPTHLEARSGWLGTAEGSSKHHTIVLGSPAHPMIAASRSGYEDKDHRQSGKEMFDNK